MNTCATHICSDVTRHHQQTTDTAMVLITCIETVCAYRRTRGSNRTRIASAARAARGALLSAETPVTLRAGVSGVTLVSLQAVQTGGPNDALRSW